MTKKQEEDPKSLKEKIIVLLEKNSVADFFLVYQDPDTLDDDTAFRGSQLWLHGVGYKAMQMSEEIIDRHIDLELGRGEEDDE